MSSGMTTLMMTMIGGRFSGDHKSFEAIMLPLSLGVFAPTVFCIEDWLSLFLYIKGRLERSAGRRTGRGVAAVLRWFPPRAFITSI
jgi:hypothetical protein